MANSPQAGAAAEKEPGRFKQIWQVLKMTVKYDKTAPWIMAAAVLVPLIIAALVSIFLPGSNALIWILTMILGLMVGVLLFMFTLNWRAERVAFGQLEGRAGAAGQVLTSAMRGTWQTSEMPVAFNAKTQDAVYRAIGKPGVVILTEGSKAGTKRLLDDERRKTARILPNVPIHHFHVGTGSEDVKLVQIRKTLNKLPKKLTKPEIVAVTSRLKALGSNALPIPKGIDPMRMRSSRSQMR
ncbi:MAG: DUF4191 domain-containing protein [Pseudoclavibacter sp.]